MVAPVKCLQCVWTKPASTPSLPSISPPPLYPSNFMNSFLSPLSPLHHQYTHRCRAIHWSAGILEGNRYTPSSPSHGSPKIAPQLGRNFISLVPPTLVFSVLTLIQCSCVQSQQPWVPVCSVPVTCGKPCWEQSSSVWAPAIVLPSLSSPVNPEPCHKSGTKLLE